MDDPFAQNASAPLGQYEQSYSFADRMLDFAGTVDLYYTPILFVFGTLGNSLSLAVFCMNAKYRSQSASYYLSALAISDTGFLVNLLAVWLERVIGGIITSGLMCPLVMYLGQVTCFMSVYLTVAFSIERYVAVHYPLSRPRICTRSKARKIIAALTGVALFLFSYAWMIAQVVEHRREGYDELFRQNVTPTASFNLSQDLDSFELPFPVGGREKRESFPFNGSSTSLHSAFLQQDGKNKKVFEKTQNCGNGSHNSFNKSLGHFSQNQSPNCTRLHLDGPILKGFGNSYPATESSSEEATLVSMEVDGFLEEEKNLANSELFLTEVFYVCSVPPDYYRISEIANYLDSVVTLIIPFFLITFFNVRIAICVWKLQRQRQNIVATPAMSSATTDNINHHHSSLRCSNTSSIHHKRKSLVKKRAMSKSSRKRQNLPEPECIDSPERDRAGEDNPQTADFGGGCKFTSHKDNARLERAGGSNDQDKIVTSDENNVPGRCDHDGSSIGSSNVARGLNVTSKRNDSLESLQATSKSTKSGVKWEQKFTASVAQPRVTAKSEFSVTRGKGTGHHATSTSSEVRVTKTLLLVSTVFLVLNLPAHAIRCYQLVQLLRGTTTAEEQDLLQALQMWTNLLFNTNFAVNFLLYCVSGKNFRKSLRNIMLRKCNNKLPNSWTSMSKTKHESIGIPNRIAKGDARPPPRRNYTKEAPENVELEERREAPVYPNNNICSVNRGTIQEVDETISV